MIQHKYGGIVPDTDTAWNDVPKYMRDKRHIYMLTAKRYDVVAYPEVVAEKTDLYIYRKVSNYTKRETMKCKTVKPSNGNGMSARLRTSGGRANFMRGDND